MTHKTKIAVSLSLLAVIVFFAYLPGLYGPFLFDDFANLNKLGDLGGVRDWETFRAFVFGGTSGPTGRPISLLTFLLNAQDWPADPFWFKATNLVAHLLCGFFLWLVCFQLLSFLSVESKARDLQFIALFVAGFWLLHPFLVSTTLYAVQRMAQLAALFCFLGLAGYLFGRRRLECSVSSGYAWMTVSIVAATLLATFSKENGVLLPVLILMMELTVFASLPSVRQLDRSWKLIFLILPTMAVIAYLSWRFFRADPWQVSSYRGFSLVERLMTEGRILVEYLRQWFFPRLYTAGVFHDQYPVSTGLLNPVSTLLSLMFHALVLALAFAYRKKYALASFGVLFFYAGHLIESTTISLELYFEHRNYLPAAFLILPVGYAIFNRLDGAVGKSLALILLFTLAAFTRYSAEIWSDYDQMVLSWANKSKDSVRAQQQASMIYYNRGREDVAIGIANDYLERHPDDYYMQLWKVTIGCRSGKIGAADIKRLQLLASKSTYDLREFKLHELFTDSYILEQCSALKGSDVEKVLANLLLVSNNANPRSARYSQIHYLLGKTYVHAGALDDAMSHFRKSLSSRPNPDSAMSIAALLASKGYFQQALVLSEVAEGYIRAGRLGATNQSAESWLENLEAFKSTVRAESRSEYPTDTEQEEDDLYDHN